MRATPSSARPKSYWGILCAAMLATAAMLAVPAAHAQSTTTTSLQISNSPVSAGTAVTLYAQVNNGSVTSGTVTFCDVTTFTFCDSAVAMGTAQLYSSGTAGIKFVPGIGVHTYEAVFNGTTSYSSSTSPTRSLTVVPTHPTTTSISSSGSAGNYIISGSISGPVDPPLFQMPGGTVTFVDQNSGNTLASAAVQGTSFSQSFNQTASPSTGSSPIFTVVGDFNGDGIPDQAIANYGSSSITILLGNGDGTFTQATGSPITVGSGPSSIAVGDFANNGKLDLAVTNFGTSTVTILLGAGDGTFTQATGSPYTVGTNPTSVAVGDFNRDGNLDLAVANYSSSNISVLTGNGSGGFTVQSSPPATGAGPITVVAGDGTALSSTQLDATANVPGTFVYNPAAGTIPADGSDTLSVTFTPTDTTDYNSATATVTLAVEGFTLTTTAGGTTSQTVAAGAAARFNFIVSPVGSARLVSAVTLSLSGLPAGATYKFTPEVIPAGSPATGVDLVIQTSPGGSSASWNMEPPDDGPQRGTTILLTLVLLPWLAIRSLRRQKRFASGLLAAVLFAGLTLGVTVGLGGCAASPQPRTYYLVVTETSSTVTHSFNLTLTVK